MSWISQAFRRFTKYSLLVAAAGNLAACASLSAQLAKPAGADLLDGPALAVPTTVDGRFVLADTSGRQVTERDFLGRPRIVYLGYTSCPEICGLELETMAAAADAVDATPETLAMLFVTLDPRRDTPDRLAAFLSHFHPTLVGLSGDEIQTQRAARAFAAYFVRNDEMSERSYTIDHSTFIYLFDAEGRFVRAFSYRSTAEDIAAALRGVRPRSAQSRA